MLCNLSETLFWSVASACFSSKWNKDLNMWRVWRSLFGKSIMFSRVYVCVRVCVCAHITFLCFLALDNLQARNCTYIFRSIISINQPICWPLFADSESSYRNFYFQHLSKLWITSFVLFFFGFSCTRTSSVRPVHHGDLLFLASARIISVCT